jgi:hypothetical protein
MNTVHMGGDSIQSIAPSSRSGLRIFPRPVLFNLFLVRCRSYVSVRHEEVEMLIAEPNPPGLWQRSTAKSDLRHPEVWQQLPNT